jgi:hypothetical protein
VTAAHDASRPGDELPDLLTVHATRRPLWVRVLCVLGALVCFALGVVGWLIPVVTGIPFYVAGLLLLGVASNRVVRAVNRLERKLPERWRRTLRHGLSAIPSRRLRRYLRLEEPPA